MLYSVNYHNVNEFMRNRPQIKECSNHKNDLNWIAELLPVAKPYREMQRINELREAVVLAQNKKIKIN